MNWAVILVLIFIMVIVGLLVYTTVMYIGIRSKYESSLISIGVYQEDIERLKRKIKNIDNSSIKIQYENLHPITLKGEKIFEADDFAWIEDKSSIESIVMKEIVEEVSLELPNFINLKQEYEPIFDRHCYKYTVTLLKKDDAE